MRHKGTEGQGMRGKIIKGYRTCRMVSELPGIYSFNVWYTGSIQYVYVPSTVGLYVPISTIST